MTANFVIPGQLLFASWNINLYEVLIEQFNYYICVENHLTDEEEPLLNTDNLEKVRRYTEAFKYLVDAKDWQRANEILLIRLDLLTDKNLGFQLGIWGYYSQQIEMYSQMYGKLNIKMDAICLKIIGIAYRWLNNFKKAQNYLDKALAIFQKLENEEHNTAEVLHELGLCLADQAHIPHPQLSHKLSPARDLSKNT